MVFTISFGYIIAVNKLEKKLRITGTLPIMNIRIAQIIKYGSLCIADFHRIKVMVGFGPTA
ncbi:MAG TPA: hypothetical protein VE548_13230 [Nitrososphaeraceae archaeon]|nr:hypothetical protein [Nitrososphaeraceae archaeon]